jgi:hypothetical protein
MSVQDNDDDSYASEVDVGSYGSFDPVFGDLEEIRYYVTDEDDVYAVVIEKVNDDQLTLIYDMDTDKNLLWVFRSLDSSLWGDAMWENNEGVVDVAESLRESEHVLLVTEDVAHHRFLKLLRCDNNIEDWRVFLVLHMNMLHEDDDISHSVSVGNESVFPEPSLSGESETDL